MPRRGDDSFFSYLPRSAAMSATWTRRSPPRALEQCRMSSDIIRERNGATGRQRHGGAQPEWLGSGAVGCPPPPPTSPDLANAALHQVPRRPSNGPLATRSHPGISWAVDEGAMSQIWAVERPQKQKHALSMMLTAAEQRRWSLFKPCERHDATLYYRGIAYQSKAKRVF